MKKILLVISFILINANLTHATELKIHALVNGEIISSEDMNNKTNLFLLSSKIPMNAQTQSMIKQKVLNNTIDEKIKLQAAQNEGITISEPEVDEQVKRFEKNNGIPKGQLSAILKQAKISEDSFKEQLRADLAWLRLIRKKYYGSGTITQKEINTKLEEAKKDLSTQKYLISEIFIKKEHAKDIHLLVSNLRKDDRFELYAMQFSEAPSAANGGNLGWINTGKLPSTIEMRLQKMSKGDISDPIFLNDGYYIIKLQQTFDPKQDKPQIPSEDDIRIMLENQKMENLSRRLLQDLRQKAVIEIRN